VPNENSSTTPWRIERTLGWAVAALLIAFAGFEYSNIDLAVQDHLYDFDHHRWLIDGGNPLLGAILYSGPKFALIAVGVAAIVLAIAPARWRARLNLDQGHRRDLAILVLTLGAIPALIGWSKSVTNVFCPYEIRRYGGAVPYVKVLARHPVEDRPESCGHCFPAGHASGGFALIAFAGLARSRRGQAIALAIGVTAGTLMGAYQMAKGSHYLSHTVITALVAWIGFCALRRVLCFDARADYPEFRSCSNHGRALINTDQMDPDR